MMNWLMGLIFFDLNDLICILCSAEIHYETSYSKGGIRIALRVYPLLPHNGGGTFGGMCKYFREWPYRSKGSVESGSVAVFCSVSGSENQIFWIFYSKDTFLL